MGIWRERAFEAVTGGLAGLFAVAAFNVVQIYAAGIEITDWLNFLGVIISITGTILGSILVLEMRNHAESRRATDNFKAALKRFIKRLEPSQLIDDADYPASWTLIENSRLQLVYYFDAIPNKDPDFAIRFTGLQAVWTSIVKATIENIAQKNPDPVARSEQLETIFFEARDAFSDFLNEI